MQLEASFVLLLCPAHLLESLGSSCCPDLLSGLNCKPRRLGNPKFLDWKVLSGMGGRSLRNLSPLSLPAPGQAPPSTALRGRKQKLQKKTFRESVSQSLQED